MAREFDRTEERPSVPMPPPLDFPEHGSPEADVLAEVEARFAKDPYPVERNFGVSYVGPPHQIAEQIRPIAAGSFFVEWARDMNPAADLFEKEAVRMLGSLLGHRDAVGFITSGGTESNLLALRLARNLGGKSEPEVVLPTTAHYSFRLGAELLGLRLREVDVDDAMRPDMRQVERWLNRNTVALVGSAPEGNFGQLDPIEELADLAQRKGLYLHVDAAFGGFALPFLRDLGYAIPPFDFSLPGVSSMMTDGHKLGLLPVATGFFLIRDEAMLDAIPAEFTGIHIITATKPGDHAVAAWSVMRRLGREGYRESARHLMEVVDIVATGIENIDGLRLLIRPLLAVVNFTSDRDDVERIYLELRRRGWGATYGHDGSQGRIRLSIHPHRDIDHAHGWVAALKESVRAVRDDA
ncbi:MAG: aminotransferase class V-fold PLP-dependent enzyme [Chloroflexi bacterium]|nr:aminotransferase class V-fold PLP-dependent enzyme [Chloroflexota bacterium]